MNQRYFIFIIHFFSLFTLSAESIKPKVVATASMWYDMAKVLGGEFIELDLIVPVGSDPHLYEPTPSDIKKLIDAKLILINGLTFETWLQKLIQSSGTSAAQVILTEGVDAITNPSFKNSTDPHAWMDVENGKVYVSNIYRALKAILPLYEKELEFNYKTYLQQLDDTHQYIISKIQAIPDKQRILISSHDAFHYYGKKYGLRVESLLGTSTEADVQTGDFIRINQLIKKNKIPAIFTETTINPKMMEQLSKENRISVGGSLYSDSLGDENSAGNTYINMLRHNTDVIAQALSRKFDDDSNLSEEDSSSPAKKIYWAIASIILLIGMYLLFRKFIKR